MKLTLLVGSAVLLAGCVAPEVSHGSPATSAASQPPVVTSPVPARPAIVVLKGDSWKFNELAIVDLSGKVQASSPVMLPSLPHDWTNAANLLGFKPPVALAAGAAFWADAAGVIHRLDRDGKVTEVTRFPIGDQQQLTFAVSPDGRRLMASVLTVPPFKQNPSYPWERDPGAKWTMQTLAANTGSAAREVARVDFTDWPTPTVVAGWDSDGPLATLNTSLAAQNPPVSVRYTGAPLIHLASDGSHRGTVGGADCFPLDSLPDGTTLCATKNGFSAPYTVRSRDGQTLWRLNVAANTYPSNPVLSPDGKRVVDLGQGQVLAQDGSVKTVSGWRQNAWQQVGWVDGQTVVLGVSTGALAHMLLIGVDDANAKPVDLGFTGYFAGVLS